MTSLVYPTPEQILNQLLTDLRHAYNRAGITINVAKGTEPYERFKVLSSRVSIAIANNKISLSSISPLDAQGNDLIELASAFGVIGRGSAAAAGNVIVGILGGGSETIPISFKCTAPDGITYETTGAKLVADDGVTQVRATIGGVNTDQDAGTILTWDSASIANLVQKCTVDVGAIDGGSNADDQETLRKRLLRKLKFPSIGGNWGAAIELAEEASSSVNSAFVYPAVRGPSTYDVAILGPSGDRILSSSIQSTVASHITSEMPGQDDLNLTSATAELLDVIIDLTLPLPQYAGGAGGGWRDATSWPSTLESGIGGKISAVNNTQITVTSTFADVPRVGNRFGIWDDSSSIMKEYTILVVSGPPGAYVITIDSSQSDELDFVTTGMYCSAGAFYLTEYANLIYNAVVGMGPGEKTDNIDYIPRGYRKPSEDVEYTSKLTSRILSVITDARPEVIDVSYAARYETGTVTTRTTASIPAAPADAPNLLTLKNLAFRRTV